MMPRVRPIALTSIALPWLLLLTPLLAAEQPTHAPAPLPDIPALLLSVEQHQAEVDRLRDEYTCRQQQRMVTYDKHGKVRKTEERTSNVFFVHGQPIETLLSKDGKSLYSLTKMDLTRDPQAELIKIRHADRAITHPLD